ncbi:hypothetical protein RZE82_07090 [Mollicutes bacterium LVI A0039]|nr:hypothetical protein RZE82_07090 [Mollicutes bacterium LVI A0039]
MYNIHDELWVVNQHKGNNTIEIELSMRIRTDIDKFLEQKYKTSLQKACPQYDVERDRAVLMDTRGYFDVLLGGTGNLEREKEFIKYIQK